MEVVTTGAVEGRAPIDPRWRMGTASEEPCNKFYVLAPLINLQACELLPFPLPKPFGNSTVPEPIVVILTNPSNNVKTSVILHGSKIRMEMESHNVSCVRVQTATPTPTSRNSSHVIGPPNKIIVWKIGVHRWWTWHGPFPMPLSIRPEPSCWIYQTETMGLQG